MPYTRSRLRAFTLVELMAVVAIVGILAVLAIVGFRRYINAAKSSEAVTVIGAIKAAQEGYKAETLQYMNVSTNLKTYFPCPAVPGAYKTGWGGSGANAQNWRILNVQVDGAVYFGYSTVAGGPGQAVPSGDLETNSKPVFPNPIEPWYVVQAKGDTNGDGKFSFAFGSSFTSEIYVEEGD